MDGVFWKLVLPRPPVTPSRKKLAKALRPKIPLNPFPTLPIDVTHDIVDACIALANECQPFRDTQFLFDLVLVCKDFRTWVEPALYHYIEISDEYPLANVVNSFAARSERPGASMEEPLKFVQDHAGTTKAISFTTVEPTPELLPQLLFVLVLLPQLERVCFPLSLLGAYDRAKSTISFFAHDVTIIMDRRPIWLDYPDGATGSEWDYRMVCTKGKKMRFTRPPHDMRTYTVQDTDSFVDQMLMREGTTHLAIETPIGDASAGKKFATWEGMAGPLCLVAGIERVVIVCWVKEEHLAEFGVPSMPQGSEQEKALIVPLAAERWEDWTFESLERRGLTFWDEIVRVGIELRGY